MLQTDDLDDIETTEEMICRNALTAPATELFTFSDHRVSSYNHCMYSKYCGYNYRQ